MSAILWSDFKSQIDGLISKKRSFSVLKKDGSSWPLFRGHASDKWKLETTLERRTKATMSLRHYMQSCSSARRYSGNYEPNSIPFDEDTSLEYSGLHRKFPNFEYIAFLRHHGFPSPLLDWTESPYIAAFFALRDTPPHDATAARVFMYTSDLGQGRCYATSSPHLQRLGPFVTVHERHAIQQCWYTISIKEQDSECEFCSHEEALTLSKTGDQLQDKIEYFDIDLNQREEALADLYGMNISAFTLFRTLDSLMETTSHRIFDIE